MTSSTTGNGTAGSVTTGSATILPSRRMPDSRWSLLLSVLRDTPDLNRHRKLLQELLVEGGRAREAESRLQVWRDKADTFGL